MHGVEQDSRILVTGSIAKDSNRFIKDSISALFHAKMPRSIAVSYLVNEVIQHRGGTGANISYSLALHGENPILLGSLSEADREYAAHLQSLGINTDHLHFSHLPTSSFEAVTDPDGNQFATFHIGAMADSEKLTLLPWGGENVFAIISAHDPIRMHQQVLECVELGIPYCFDIGQQTNNPAPGLIRDGIANASILIANDHEMQVLADIMGTTPELMSREVPLYITTRGKRGSTIAGRDVETPIHIPAAPVAEVKDPTGAGDAFRAGLIVGMLRGHDLKTAGEWGAVTAAYCVEQSGAQNHRFTQPEFETRLQAFQTLSETR